MLSISLRWPSQMGIEGLRSSIGRTGLRNASITRSIARSQVKRAGIARYPSSISNIRNSSTEASPENAFKDRLQKVQETHPEPYPRLATDSRRMSTAEFQSRYSQVANNETVDDIVVLHGRIRSTRASGNKLRFFDLFQNQHKVQVLCNLHRMDGVSAAEFRDTHRVFRRGDAFSVTGRPHRTQRGELSLEATELPRLLSPCLHDIPLDRDEPETSPYSRLVQFLNQNKIVHVVKARSAIIQYLRQFLLDRSFMEVNTPILESIAGGATARPFHTAATEFPERLLSLRIAPELWLKRFVVGGFDKVFEIGPSFRNEGLDRTHNPEFMTCEFYHAYANLEDLMSLTESLLSGMAAYVRQLNESEALEPTNLDFTPPFRRIDFTTGIEERVNRKLPDLTSPDAQAHLTQLFNDISLPPPENPTLPRLVDELSATYLEPECISPTFIVNPPECLSPLSKSFTHPVTNQRVAARCELFVEGNEVVNFYEEENSPFAQRRKFEEQASLQSQLQRGQSTVDVGGKENENRDVGELGTNRIDESYLNALEWGLPPTGGWGCGIDRLCMLFTGVKRIGDVLPFGSLRAVTGMKHEVSLSGRFGLGGRDAGSK